MKPRSYTKLINLTIWNLLNILNSDNHNNQGQGQTKNWEKLFA